MNGLADLAEDYHRALAEIEEVVVEDVLAPKHFATLCNLLPDVTNELAGKMAVPGEMITWAMFAGVMTGYLLGTGHERVGHRWVVV